MLVTIPAAKVYFVVFHIVVVLVIMNIFIAFVLEAFVLEMEMSNTEIEDMLLSKLDDEIERSPSLKEEFSRVELRKSRVRFFRFGGWGLGAPAPAPCHMPGGTASPLLHSPFPSSPGSSCGRTSRVASPHPASPHPAPKPKSIAAAARWRSVGEMPLFVVVLRCGF